MKQIKTIIFDFDGTLADCKQLHAIGFRRAITTLIPNIEYKDEIVEGLPTYEKINMLRSFGHSIDGDLVSDLKQRHTIKHITDYLVYDPKLAAMLTELSTRFHVCLASNATKPFITRSLDIMKITHCFKHIHTATDYPAKPNTRTFLDCMLKTNSTPSETLIVEDSEVGVMCARTTGCHVVQVNNVTETKLVISTLLI